MLASRNIQSQPKFPSSNLPNGSSTNTAQSSEDRPQASLNSAPPLLSRPSHFRSRSYLSGLRTPIEPQPRNAVTLPVDGSPPTHLAKSGSGSTGKVSATRDRDPGDESSTSSKLPRLHLPGSSRAREGKEKDKDHRHRHLHPHGSYSRHRHTRSDVPKSLFGDGSVSAIEPGHHHLLHLGGGMNEGLLVPGVAGGGVKNDNRSSMLTRMASNLSSRNIGAPGYVPHHQHSRSDLHRALGGDAARKPDLRRRATSDPRAPAYGKLTGREGAQAQFGVATYLDGPRVVEDRQKPMTEIELLLYKAEKEQKEAAANLTEEDVNRLSIQLAESNVELLEHLDGTSKTYSTLMRRLDDAFYKLETTASALLDTISSFQTLCEQSSVLIKNFDNKSQQLSAEMIHTLDRHRAALFDTRGSKITELETRGKSANDRAEDLSRRLDNCRTIVKNYTERQQTKQRAWKGVLMGSLCGFIIILFGFVLGVSLWWYRKYGNDAIASLSDTQGLLTANGRLHEVVKQRLQSQNESSKVGLFENLPSEVREVLEDIEARHNGSHADAKYAEAERHTDSPVASDIADEAKLKKLFDKLEL